MSIWSVCNFLGIFSSFLSLAICTETQFASTIPPLFLTLFVAFLVFSLFLCHIFRLRPTLHILLCGNICSVMIVCTDALCHFFHRIVQTRSLVYNIVYFPETQKNCKLLVWIDDWNTEPKSRGVARNAIHEWAAQNSNNK